MNNSVVENLERAAVFSQNTIGYLIFKYVQYKMLYLMPSYYCVYDLNPTEIRNQMTDDFVFLMVAIRRQLLSS